MTLNHVGRRREGLIVGNDTKCLQELAIGNKVSVPCFHIPLVDRCHFLLLSSVDEEHCLPKRAKGLRGEDDRFRALGVVPGHHLDVFLIVHRSLHAVL